MVLALSLHFWFGAVGTGWWYMEWLIARADDALSTDNMVTIIVLGGLLWLAAGYAIIRTNRTRPRLTWLLLIGWVVAFALLFLLR
jgi:hypothetical protein